MKNLKKTDGKKMGDAILSPWGNGFIKLCDKNGQFWGFVLHIYFSIFLTPSFSYMVFKKKLSNFLEIVLLVH